VRNITDIDDKIINKAKKEFPDKDINDATKLVAEKYLKSYHECMNKLDIKEPDFEPKATEYIDKMILFIQGLITRGVAYESGGDVYFDIAKAKDYGKLSNQSLDEMEAGSRINPGDKKKNPLDFALWKAAKEGEPYWQSPWGRGRPGWHIECSVMSSDILGDEFDIHGGGIDLIFPHHENEIAQSEGMGKKFARYWIHNGLLTIKGQKMAKSLGNFVTIEEIISRHYPLDILKLLFLQTHYSHPVDFTWEKMDEIKKSYERIYVLREKLIKEYGVVDIDRIISSGAGSIYEFKERFNQAMDDNFNTAGALAVLFDMINRCNVLLGSNEPLKPFMLRAALMIMKEMADIFGLSFFQEGLSEDEKKQIEEKINLRLGYKKQKRFKEADEIRKELESKGIILEDTKEGTSWRREL
jgi:cysteinyl-tRNA synthetase